MQVIEFICPLCQGPLRRESEAYVCARDQRSYPVTLGIPDFRVCPDQLVQPDTEQALVARLLAEYPNRSFAELVDLDRSLRPAVPSSLTARRRVHIEGGVVRAKSSLAEIHRLGALPAQGQFLEIGCGTGGFLVAAADMFRTVVGLDVSLPRLVLAKKQLEETGRQAIVISACAESLPFSDKSFHLVVGSDVIEHVEDPVQVMREAYRVLVPGGAIFLATPNRWSLTPEPHVNVWGLDSCQRHGVNAMSRWCRMFPIGISACSTGSKFDDCSVKHGLAGGKSSFPHSPLNTLHDCRPGPAPPCRSIMHSKTTP